uniref:hypothetical protein n=1 Tax=Pseudomonas aeruginosa TaxID=287 RepID=UPI00093DC40A|nr:hypothetical protein [Pseudomonas aeruginosa]
MLGQVKMPAVIIFSMGVGIAQAAVDLDKICMLKDKGYEAGEVLILSEGVKKCGAEGMVCSTVNGEGVWLMLADRSIASVMLSLKQAGQQAN